MADGPSSSRRHDGIIRADTMASENKTKLSFPARGNSRWLDFIWILGFAPDTFGKSCLLSTSGRGAFGTARKVSACYYLC
jgi:hypothetical protein